MIYLFVLFLLLFLSFRYDICGKIKYRNQWYLVILIIFILIAGLRYRIGIDTPRYMFAFYHDYPTIDKFSFNHYYIGKDPFYVLINSVVRSLKGRFYIVQIINAIFVNFLILNYIKKHSKYLFTCAFFYFLLLYTGLLMEAMPASFSVAICLYANDYFQEKKWVKGYLLLLIATLFHAQTLALFVLPLFFSLRFNKCGILMLFIAYIGGIFLQQILGDYAFLLEGNAQLEHKVSSYAESDKYGENDRSLFYSIFKIILPVVYCIFSLWYCKRYSRNKNLMLMEPFIMLGLMFVMVQASFVIAYRYVHYYVIYFIFFYAETFICMIKRSEHLNIGLAYIKCVILFLPLMINSLHFFNDCRYYPYSSVITKSVNKERENRFKKADNYFYPKSNEY